MLAGLVAHYFELAPRFVELVHLEQRDGHRKAGAQNQSRVYVERGPKLRHGCVVPILLQVVIPFPEMRFDCCTRVLSSRLLACGEATEQQCGYGEKERAG